MFLYVTTIISTILTVVVTYFVKKFIEKRQPLLVSYLTTATGKFVLTQKDKAPQPIVINTHTIIIRNPGNKMIENIRVIHSLPQKLKEFGVKDIREIINIYPNTKFNFECTESESMVDENEIIILKLIPKDFVTITYLYPPHVTFYEFNIRVKSDEGFGELASYSLQRTYPKWLDAVLWALIFIGSIVTINFIIKLVSIINTC